MATFYVISISSAGRGMCGASPLAPQDGWAEDQLSPLAKRSPGSFGPPDSSHRRLLTSALTFNPHPVGGTPSASLRGALRLPSLEGAAGPRQPEAVVVRGVSLQLQAVWPDPPPTHRGRRAKSGTRSARGASYGRCRRSSSRPSNRTGRPLIATALAPIQAALVHLAARASVRALPHRAASLPPLLPLARTPLRLTSAPAALCCLALRASRVGARGMLALWRRSPQASGGECRPCAGVWWEVPVDGFRVLPVSPLFAWGSGRDSRPTPRTLAALGHTDCNFAFAVMSSVSPV